MKNSKYVICNFKSALLVFAALFLLFPVSILKADWKIDANDRIEQIRKRDVQLSVVDSDGKPLSNIYVQVKQVRHRFAFGSCINYGQLSSNSNYRNFFLEHFEWAVCENEMKWASNESSRDNENYNQADFMANWCADNGIKLRGHCLVWETGNQEPSWVSGLACNPYPNSSAKLSEINERIKSAVGRYKGQILQWDIDNEMLSGNKFDCLGEAGRAHFFELANQTDPDCGMYMNEYSGNSFGSYDGDRYANRARGLINLGAPIEGLGIQAHVNSPFQPERYYSNVLQELAVLDLPIMVTEYDTDSATATESQRAEDLENFYRICFSHPNVEGIIMWGFLDGACWRGNGIVKSDWTLNEAGVRYEKLLNEWTSNESGFTDSYGGLNFRGFHGTYEITLSAAGMPTEVYEVELEPDDRPAQLVFETNLKSTIPIKNINSDKEYTSIQDAINDADPCDVIIVSSGVYNEDIDFLGKNITLSSFNPDDSEIVANTIIDGIEHAVNFVSGEDSNSVILGFTITGAKRGVFCSASSPLIKRCRIIENEYSGIVLDKMSSPIISYCEILSNKESGVCTIGRDNCNPLINHSVIAGNRKYGIKSMMPIVENCTIVSNGMVGIIGGNLTVYNSIIFYNNPDNNNIQIDGTAAQVTYSDIQGGWAGEGNIDSEPLFAMPGYWVDVNDPNFIVEYDDPNAVWKNGDYHIMSAVGRWNPVNNIWVQDDVNSPCIDAGDPNSGCSHELWPHGDIVNMGAYGDTPQASMSESDIGDTRDLNNDDLITWNDILLFADKWDCENMPLKEDFDRNCIVDANDLVFFYGNWASGSYNTMPILDSIEDKYVNVGELLSFSISVIDNDSDELEYMALGMPDRAEFSDVMFSWIPEQAGTYLVTFIVSDYKSLNYITVKIIVNDKL